jgi:hypothetical protein
MCKHCRSATHEKCQLLYFPIAVDRVGLSIYREPAHGLIQTAALLIGEYVALGTMAISVSLWYKIVLQHQPDCMIITTRRHNRVFRR